VLSQRGEEALQLQPGAREYALLEEQRGLGEPRREGVGARLAEVVVGEVEDAELAEPRRSRQKLCDGLAALGAHADGGERERGGDVAALREALAESGGAGVAQVRLGDGDVLERLQPQRQHARERGHGGSADAHADEDELGDRGGDGEHGHECGAAIVLEGEVYGDEGGEPTRILDGADEREDVLGALAAVEEGERGADVEQRVLDLEAGHQVVQHLHALRDAAAVALGQIRGEHAVLFIGLG
jgi:hypothetical protein